jgi:hypothetical protein
LEPKDPVAPVAEPPVDPAPTPPTGEPAAPPAEPAPTEPTNPASAEPDKPWTVPGDRFQQEVEKRKEAEAKAAALEAQTNPPEPESQIDPETDKILQQWAKDQGLVSRKDLDAQNEARQRQQDLLEVKSEFKLNDEQVRELAAEADKAGAVNRDGLRNAYLAKNLDKIVEDRVKAQLAAGTTPEAAAEKPGVSGGGTPSGTEPKLNKDMTAAERIKARISAARDK